MAPPLLLLIAASLAGFAEPFQFGGKASVPAAVSPYAIREIPIDRHDADTLAPESIKQILHIVRNVDKMPSCDKAVAKALLHSCGTYDPDSAQQSSDLFLEEERDIYGIRLALCEVRRATPTTPRACDPFIVREDTVSNNDLSRAKIDKCLKELYPIEQAWTSYSTSRKNSFVMCHAMRSEIEKDEQIYVSKILAQTATDASQSLHNAAAMSREIMSDFNALKSAIPSFQHDLAAGYKEQQDAIAQMWAAVRRMNDGVGHANDQVKELNKGIRGAIDSIFDMQDRMKTAGDETAVALQNTFDPIRASMNDVGTGIGTVSGQIDYLKLVLSNQLTQELSAAGQSVSNINAMMPNIRNAIDNFMATTIENTDYSIAKSREHRAILEANSAAMSTIIDKVDLANATVTNMVNVLNLVTGGAFSHLSKGPEFALHWFVLTLMSFGVWEKCFGFSFVGNAMFSLGSGFALAVVTIKFDHREWIIDTVTLSTMDSPFVNGVVTGVALAAASAGMIFLLSRLFRRKGFISDAEYDPASPVLPEHEEGEWPV